MSEKERREEFISGTSHEIRTLLNTIIGLSDDINSYETIPEEIREDAEDLESASKELLELINNILDYNKIETDRMVIVNTISSALPYELIGDKQHIKEVVNNLITNAIKYTDGGDIWFNVECINDNEDCNITISVKDTGRGIKKERLEKLFAKFEKLNIERDTSREGTGLGLAITKSLVEMMGGKIEVESVYGEGTTFTINLPQKISLMEEPDLTRTQRLELEKINYDEEGYGYKKILIVDDNILNIKVARRALEQFDLILEECHNGEECLETIAEDSDYDLILMDIMMPVMGGEETFRKLKEIEGFDIPVIALTADAVEGSQEKYENEGFVDYIPKPFSKMQIKEKLDKVFKQREILEEKQEMWNEDE